MSKERLEEINKRVKRSDEYAEKGLWEASDGMIVHLHNEGHINYLIERVQELEEIKNDAIEQIDVTQRRNKRLEERVQELEEESYNAHLERLLDRKEQQNKRYREAFRQIKLQILLKGAIESYRENIIEIIDEALEG